MRIGRGGSRSEKIHFRKNVFCSNIWAFYSENMHLHDLFRLRSNLALGVCVKMVKSLISQVCFLSHSERCTFYKIDVIKYGCKTYALWSSSSKQRTTLADCLQGRAKKAWRNIKAYIMTCSQLSRSEGIRDYIHTDVRVDTGELSKGTEMRLGIEVSSQVMMMMIIKVRTHLLWYWTYHSL